MNKHRYLGAAVGRRVGHVTHARRAAHGLRMRARRHERRTVAADRLPKSGAKIPRHEGIDDGVDAAVGVGHKGERLARVSQKPNQYSGHEERLFSTFSFFLFLHFLVVTLSFEA